MKRPTGAGSNSRVCSPFCILEGGTAPFRRGDVYEPGRRSGLRRKARPCRPPTWPRRADPSPSVWSGDVYEPDRRSGHRRTARPGLATVILALVSERSMKSLADVRVLRNVRFASTVIALRTGRCGGLARKRRPYGGVTKRRRRPDVRFIFGDSWNASIRRCPNPGGRRLAGRRGRPMRHGR